MALKLCRLGQRLLSRCPAALKKTSQPINEGSRTFTSGRCLSSNFEPDDLDIPPDIPEYPTLNIHMYGYDFPILESYAKYVHNFAKSIDLETDSWPVPAQTSKVSTFVPNSSNTKDSYEVALCHRTVQIDGLQSTMAPILIQVLQQQLPEGVSFSIREPDADEEDFRYVPDLEMRALQEQVEDIDQARTDRRKK